MTDKFMTPETMIIAGMMDRDFENIIPYLLRKSREFLVSEGFIENDVEDLVLEIQLHHIGGYNFPFNDPIDCAMQLVNAIGEWEEAKTRNDHRLISNAVHKIISYSLAGSGYLHEVTDEQVEMMQKNITDNKKARSKGGKTKAYPDITILSYRKKAREIKIKDRSLIKAEIVHRLTNLESIDPAELNIPSSKTPPKYSVVNGWLVSYEDESKDPNTSK